MLKVRDVLKAKNDNICSISLKDTANSALQIIAEKNIEALVVTDRGCVVGIFSENDCKHIKISETRSLKKTPVRELMSSQVYSISPEKSVEECRTLMTEKHCRHLPVFENNRLIGLVSIEDVVNS